MRNQMIDLEDFELEVKCVPDNECVLLTKDEAVELVNRLRRAEKDAVRWNYVINNHCIGNMNMGLYADYNYGMDVVTKDDAVAIIDEAIGATINQK